MTVRSTQSGAVCQETAPQWRDLLREAAFSGLLGPAEVSRIASNLRPRDVRAGAHVAWRGDSVEHWIVVANGMLKVEATAGDGRHTTLIAVTRAGWLGESALLADGRWPCSVVATRPTRLGLLPRAVFEELLATSVSFGRALLYQLNARLRQFARRCEQERLGDTQRQVAHCLAELFDPDLYPATRRQLAISQDEVAHLAGVSRPTANRALHELATLGLLSVAYGAITVNDPNALKRLSSIL